MSLVDPRRSIPKTASQGWNEASSKNSRSMARRINPDNRSYYGMDPDLAAKPELRYLPSGTKVSNARLGETYRYRDHEGQSLSHTNWHSLTFYDDLAELAVTYEQGENLFLEGTLQQRKFTPKDGVTRTV